MVTKIRELACIPSSESVKNRLESVLAEARKLKILLRTARDLEQDAAREQGGDDDK